MVDYNSLADRLLKDGFLLTALEFHTELQERGRTLKSLQKFFEDSSNFETFTRKLDRSPAPSVSSIAGSQATLDDLSLFEVTRYSEDSHQQPDDRVAVLEFELRKARETIHSLRDELTQQAVQYAELLRANNSSGSNRSHSTSGFGTSSEGGMSSSQHQVISENSSSSITLSNQQLVEDDGNESNDDTDDDDERAIPGIQKHEQRTINYLVNEYLLQHNYKLTSITFSDENSEEDFEDWDSIGLNVSKPPNLLRLYRDFKRHVVPTKLTFQQAVQTLPDEEFQNLVKKVQDLEGQIEVMRQLTSEQIEIIDHLRQQLTEAQLKSEQLEKSLTDLNRNVDKVTAEIASIVSFETLEATEQFCRESIPQTFFDFMFEKCCAEIPSNNNLSILCEGSFDKVITLLSLSLPKIVPNVLLAKRDELIPLLLISIQHNVDERCRDELLHLLFNLIKRPDASQRHMIVAGFKKIAENFPDRIESELLPQIWEQITHKYVERRILIAETCTLLLPNIPGPLRNSLVYSILNQLISDDRDVQVRQSAINALSLLVLSIRDPDKWSPLFELLVSLLKDPSPELVECVQSKLLPSFSLWSLELNRLESILVMNRLEDLDQHCDLTKGIEDNFAGDMSSKRSLQGIVLSKLETVSILIPFLIFSVIKSAPMPDEPTPSSDEKMEGKMSKDFLFLLLAASGEHWKLEELGEYLCREWYEPWPQLDWISKSLVPNLLNCISKVPISSCDKIVLKFASLFRRIGFYLGSGFVQSNLIPAFKNVLPMLEATSEAMFADDPKSQNDIFVYTKSGLVPTYFLGVLDKCSPTNQSDTLRRWSVLYCLSRWSTDPIVFSLKNLFLIHEEESDELHDLRDAVSEMAWSLVVHSTMKLRCFSGTILALLAESSDRARDNLIGTKILPGLITLSSDSETSVRVSSVSGLCRVVSSIKTSDETREKACFQLLSYLDSNSIQQRPAEHEIRTEVVKQLGELVANVRGFDSLAIKLRDEVLLPKLTELNFKYSSLYSEDSSKSVEYLEMFTAILGAYKTIIFATTAPSDDDMPKLPLQVIQIQIVPSLQKLGADFRKSSPPQETSANQLIGQLEAAYGRTFVLHLSHPHAISQDSSSTAATHHLSLLTPSPSIDEMKSRVGKIFQKPAQSFWKK